MTLLEAENIIQSKRYSIDINPEIAYIEVEKIVNKKVTKIREKCTILAVGISEYNEIMYLIEKDGKRFYKLKKEVKK